MMKFTNWILVICAAFLFSSCLDTVEELTLRENGSGQVNVKMDMGGLLEMAKGMMAGEELSEMEKQRSVDTVIMMRTLTDTARNLSPETKALFKDAELRMKMDMQKNIFKIDMMYPFKNLQELNQLQTAIREGGGVMNALKSMPGENLDAPSEDLDGMDNLATPGNIYDIVVTPNRYSKTVNKAKLKSLMDNPKMEEAKGMMGMMGDMKASTVVNLPRPAKSVSNTAATLSADKKTVTLQYNIFDIFDAPEKAELNIEY
jgi:hypothetical protein